MRRYVSLFIPETRKYFSQPPYSEAFLSLCNNDKRKNFEEINRRGAQRFLACVSRVATAGSLTRNDDLPPVFDTTVS